MTKHYIRFFHVISAAAAAALLVTAGGCQSSPSTRGNPELAVFNIKSEWLGRARQLRHDKPELFAGAKGLLVTKAPDSLSVKPNDIIIAINGRAADQATQVNQIFGEVQWLRQGKTHKARLDSHFRDVQVMELGEREPPQRPLLVLENNMHMSTIRDICSDNRFRYLLSASEDKTLRLWDRKSGKQLKVFRVPIDNGDEGQLYACAMSRDGRYALGAGITGWSWSGRSRIYIFDTQSGKLAHTIDGLPERISDMDVSADGKLAVGMLGRGGVHIYELNTRKLLWKDSNYGDKVNRLDYDRNGRLVTASRDGFVRLYSAAFKRLHKRKLSVGDMPLSVDFSPGGDQVVVTFLDRMSVHVISGHNLKELYPLQTTGRGVVRRFFYIRVAWSLDGRYIYGAGGVAKASFRRFVRRWSIANKGKYEDFALSNLPVNAMLPLDNNHLAVGTKDPMLRLLDADGNTVYEHRPALADFRGYRSLRLSPDGQQVQFSYVFKGPPTQRFDVSGILSSNADVQAFDLPERQGMPVKRWKRGFNPLFKGRPLLANKYERMRALAVSPDKRSFALSSHKFIRYFDSTGRLLWKKPSHGIAYNTAISKDGRYVVTTSSGGTIRWYNRHNGEELLAFLPYARGKKWIMWTPEGFFQAHNGAETMVGFHLNQGHGQPKFVSVDQLYDRFYRPDLVAMKMDPGRSEQVSKLAQQVELKDILGGGLPPQVFIETPKNQMLAKQETVPLRLCLRLREGGLGKIIYKINDVTVAVEAPTARGLKRRSVMENCDHRLEKNLVLENGVNTIRITAFNERNLVESKPAVVHVRYHGVKTVKPNLHVLTLAVNNYRDSSLKLTYPVADAEAVSRVIGKSAAKLFAKIHQYTLTDKAVNTRTIAQTFDKIAAKVRPGDVFVFFVAAHGIAEKGKYFVLPQDFVYRNEQSLNKDAISQDMLQSWLSRVPAKKSVVLLDTCNSGAFADLRTRGLAEKTAINKLMRATGRVTLAASTGNQEALEGYKGHGVFTYALLQGFSGLADKAGNGDGQISVNELAEFVGEQVPRITQQVWGKEQFPMQSLLGRSFPIGVVIKN